MPQCSSRRASTVSARSSSRYESASRGEANASPTPVGPGRLAERDLAQQPRERERDERQHRRHDEDRRERVDERVDVRHVELGRQAADDRRARLRRRPHACRETARPARVCSRLTKIVPKSATPIEPPICRDSVDPEVATPSSL